MSWLDNLITFFSPEAGARRMAWRNACEELRNYDAGNFGRVNSHWRVTNDSAEVTDRYSREQVRARARDLERNSDIMNSVLGAYKRNVIGSGFQIQAKTENEDLNKELEKLWRRWCKARNCDVTGQQSLNQMLRMAVVRKKVDGGVLFVKRYTKDGMIPFSLQMIEVDELDNTQIIPKDSRNRVVGGIEYNEYNRPTGYWIKQYTIDGFTIADTKYVKANDVIFFYSKKRPSQIREMSDMAHTATRIRDVNEFMNAVSVKQRIEACLSVFIKKQLPVSGTLGRAGTAVGPDGRFSYDGKTLTPGMIRELNAGDDIEVVNPTGQSADATSFVKLQQRLVGAGQGISYEATSRDMSETTYASARQGAIEDEMTFQEEKELVMSLLDEIYETFVISCWVSGLITARDFWDKKDDYLSHEWIQPPKKWIDPAKEAGAMVVALNAGVKTYKQICAENGVDWRSQIDDIAEVQNYAENIGLGNFNSVIFDGKLTEEVEDNASDLTPEEGGEAPEDDGEERPDDEEGNDKRRR